MESHDHNREDFKSAMIGLVVALVGLFAVMGVSYYMAL